MTHVRSLFLSDIHLGTPDARAEALLDLLGRVQAEEIFLVGDILDLWKLKGGGWHWPEAHSTLLQRFAELAQSGVQVHYLPGNHDEFFRDFIGGHFHGVAIEREFDYRTRDGQRLWLVHGDVFDEHVRHNVIAKFVGNLGYEALLWLNRKLNAWRRLRGRGYWSLSGFLKREITNARAYIDKFEQAAASTARERGFEGVICGHIHFPNLRDIDGIRYGNCGDWVEHGSFLVEHLDGRLELIDWMQHSDVFLQRAGLAQTLPSPVTG